MASPAFRLLRVARRPVSMLPLPASVLRFSPVASSRLRRSVLAAGFSTAASPSAPPVSFPDHRVGVNSSGAKVERPISPHVTIYSQPIPAVSSITNRATGVMLTVGVAAMGLTALAGSCDLAGTVSSFQQSVPALVPVAKSVVAWPLVYHTLAGVRHLYWDYTAKGLDLKTAEMTSRILIAASVVLALTAAFVSLPPLPHKQQQQRQQQLSASRR